jgi:hypothetical protein
MPQRAHHDEGWKYYEYNSPDYTTFFGVGIFIVEAGDQQDNSSRNSNKYSDNRNKPEEGEEVIHAGLNRFFHGEEG